MAYQSLAFISVARLTPLSLSSFPGFAFSLFYSRGVRYCTNDFFINVIDFLNLAVSQAYLISLLMEKNEKSMIRTQVFSVQYKASIPHNRIVLQEYFSRLLLYSIAGSTGVLSVSSCAIRKVGLSSGGCS